MKFEFRVDNILSQGYFEPAVKHTDGLQLTAFR